MPLAHENFRLFWEFCFFLSGTFFLFWELFVSSYKESPYEGSKISPFSNLCPIYLNKVILRIPQIQYFEIHHEVFIDKVLMKIQKLSFVHFISLKFFETTLKFLLYLNLLGNSYK